jgi:glycosyltransferase involved in cell wall biosynthesis
MKISVIMPSYLGPYEGSASNRIERFKRAVNSFLAQQWPNSELIIIADGCDITVDTYQNMYSEEKRREFAINNHPIYLLHIEKQPHFSGVPRNTGIDAATGDVICYLDTDDVFMSGHLQAIAAGFNQGPDAANYRRWVYFDDFVAGPDLHPQRQRTTNLNYGGIGTSGLAHEKSLAITWPDNYGHDWLFVRQLMAVCPLNKKIEGPKYLVCHIHPTVDF